MNTLNIPPDIVFGVIATVASIIAAVFSKRASSWAKASSMTVKLVRTIIGRPDPVTATHTAGVTLTEKVERLDDNQRAILKLLLLMVEDTNRGRGPGRRRIPTERIELPEGFINPTSLADLVEDHDR